MNWRKWCKCGCGESVAHRRFGTIWATDGCRKAYERGNAPANADISRTRTASKPSGRQLSYLKTYRNMEDGFGERPEYEDCPKLLTPREALNIALGVLDESLPERQRALLEERQTTEGRKAA